MEQKVATQLLSQMAEQQTVGEENGGLWGNFGSPAMVKALILAVRLGNGADTVAVVTGQLAGAAFGASGIPDRWL